VGVGALKVTHSRIHAFTHSKKLYVTFYFALRLMREKGKGERFDLSTFSPFSTKMHIIPSISNAKSLSILIYKF
jgi:hypothetical protein